MLIELLAVELRRLIPREVVTVKNKLLFYSVTALLGRKIRFEEVETSVANLLGRFELLKKLASFLRLDGGVRVCGWSRVT